MVVLEIRPPSTLHPTICLPGEWSEATAGFAVLCSRVSCLPSNMVRPCPRPCPMCAASKVGCCPQMNLESYVKSCRAVNQEISSHSFIHMKPSDTYGVQSLFYASERKLGKMNLKTCNIVTRTR